jgi:hypothetical protein
MRARLSTLLALIGCLVCLALALAAASAGRSPGHPGTHKTASSTRGPRGVHGPAGPPGTTGATGAPGPGPRLQSISIDWQNNTYEGHDVATFTVPGIGTGEVQCSHDTQWIRLVPSDHGADTEMWAATMHENKMAVRAAARRSYAWGPDYYLGLNQVNGTEPEAHGQMRGIISTRGGIGALAPTGLAAPATFTLSWYWSFTDAQSARCYVTGLVVTGS